MVCPSVYDYAQFVHMCQHFYILYSMCYSICMKSPILNRKQRMTRGEQNFEKYLLPLVQDKFPGVWHSCNEQPLDYEHGIDYVVVNGASITTIAARVWMSHPKSHFTLRWKRTSDPFRQLELGSRMDAFHNGGLISDWTIEGFFYNDKSYVAMVPTIRLLDVVDRYFECLPKFMIQNQKDFTLFKRVSFYDYGLDDYIEKVIDRF